MTSDERAATGAQIIKVYGLYTGPTAADSSEALRQLLCDLLVWSRRAGVDFPTALRHAIQTRDSEYIEEQLNWKGEE